MLKKSIIAPLFLSFIYASAQDSMPAKPVVCYGEEGTNLTQIVSAIPIKNARTNAVLFSFSYDSNVPVAAQAAIERAGSIWANLLNSTMPIRVTVTWQALSGTTLAQTGTTNYRNFSGAIYQNIWYPVTLAEALAGKELNSGGADITVNLSSKYAWNYATDGKAIAGKYDLVSVVLHELTHGLGFSGTFSLNSTDNTQGQWGDFDTSNKLKTATIFDIYLEDAKNQLLTNTGIYGNPSTGLLTAMTNNSLYYTLKSNQYLNNPPKLYAPSTFASGTSISHLDETTYPQGNSNSLLTPFVHSGEVIQNPGDILLHILSEMGWTINSLVTSTESLAVPNLETKVLPNPTSDLLVVAIPDKGVPRDVRLEICNFEGQILKTVEETAITSKTLELSIGEFPCGAYFLRVTDTFGVVTKKFIKW